MSSQLWSRSASLSPDLTSAHAHTQNHTYSLLSQLFGAPLLCLAAAAAASGEARLLLAAMRSAPLLPQAAPPQGGRSNGACGVGNGEAPTSAAVAAPARHATSYSGGEPPLRPSAPLLKPPRRAQTPGYCAVAACLPLPWKQLFKTI
jgi:hypothetical protein